jgi:hypothetical protein
MTGADREHLAATHALAVRLDGELRLGLRDLIDESLDAGSVGEIVRRLREHGDYWERVPRGRLRRVKLALARLMQPFFKPQIRYNLVVAEQLGRIEVALDGMRRQIDELRAATPTAARR